MFELLYFFIVRWPYFVYKYVLGSYLVYFEIVRWPNFIYCTY